VASELDALRAVVGLAPDPEARSARELLLTAFARVPGRPGRTTAEPVRRFRLAPDPVSAPELHGWGDPDEPLVYVSFGTEVPSPNRPYFPGLYRGVLQALADLPVRVLVRIGDRRDPGELGPLPRSVRVEHWVAQAAVMRKAIATVGHGGSGSVLGALAGGVPMALIPLFADQPRNARHAAELGTAIALNDGPAATSALTTVVHELLTNPGYRAAARRIANLPPIDEAVKPLAALTERP